MLAVRCANFKSIDQIFHELLAEITFLPSFDQLPTHGPKARADSLL